MDPRKEMGLLISLEHSPPGKNEQRKHETPPKLILYEPFMSLR